MQGTERGGARASLLRAEASLPKAGFTAPDIWLLELIRWLITINTAFFCRCLRAWASPAACTRQSRAEPVPRFEGLSGEGGSKSFLTC